jgi:dynein heavy chain, axonemal
MQRLDQEKDDFCRTLLEFDNRFKQIIKFNSIDQIQDFSKLAFNLSQNIQTAKEKIEQFNERETTFNQTISEYTSLDELERNFKPFYDLLENSSQALSSIHDWTNQALVTQDYQNMESSIAAWHMVCFQLNKKLAEDYEETAEVALRVKEKIEAFRNHLPLIKCINTEAMTEEDWGYVQKAVGQDSMDRDQVTVLSFETYKL